MLNKKKNKYIRKQHQKAQPTNQSTPKTQKKTKQSKTPPMHFALEVLGANSVSSIFSLCVFLVKKKNRHEELNSCLYVTVWRELQSLEKLFELLAV